jgi:hypothetical protein
MAMTACVTPRSVVVTADDGHESVFTEMSPVVRAHRYP